MANRPNNSEKYSVELNAKDENDVRIIAFSFIMENTKVLDVGCANGDFGKLLNTKKSCVMVGIDNNDDRIGDARKTESYDKIYLLDLNKLDISLLSEYRNYFDYIAILDVLEHLENPELVIEFFKPLLKKDGYFIFSIPNVSFYKIKLDLLFDKFEYSDTGILDDTHIKFFTHNSINTLVTNMNLEVEKCIPKFKYYKNNDWQIPRSIIRFIERNPHSYVYQYVLQLKISKSGTEELKELNESKMNIEKRVISAYIRKERAKKIYHRIIPSESFLHTLLRKVFNM